jgi:DhnA family fructose-bisphosphate aldolase class Ia
MNGKEIRLTKLFSRGKAVVVALDHGGYMGPIKGLEDLPGKINLYKKADAVLINPNMAKYCGKFFSSWDSPLMIIRVNWGSHYCEGFKKGYQRRMATVRKAVNLGADMIMASLLLGGSEEANTENITLLGEIYEETESLGVPLIGEYIPLEGIDRFKGKESEVELGVRMCAEIGSDLIKTVYIPGFSNLVKSVPIPVLALGGARMDTDLEALKFAKESIREGAAGVVFGRNVFQAENPEKFLNALIKVVREGQHLEKVIE